MSAFDIAVFECQMVLLEDLLDDVQPELFAPPCVLFG
jgi:hypothetical protein